MGGCATMARCLECEGNPRHQRGADGKLGDAFIKPLDAKVMLYSRVPHESVSLNNLSECNVLGCLEQAALVFTAKRVPRRCGVRQMESTYVVSYRCQTYVL